MSRFARTTLALVVVASATLAGCGRGMTGVAPGVAVQASGTEAMAGGLSSKVKRLFHEIFDLYDADDSGKWEPKDFTLDEKRFLNLFHNYDADDDRVVTLAEFYPKERHDDMVVSIEARAEVSAAGVNGRVGFDKAMFFLDVYLKPYLNAGDRKRFITKAFAQADDDDSKFLKAKELEIAFAILEAKAVEKGIEKQVNRSIGQPNAKIDLDGPSWVKKKKSE